MTIALIAFTVGVILMGTAPVEQTYWAQIFVSICVQPFGMDMSFPASTLIVSNALPKKKQGVGASLVNTIVNYRYASMQGFEDIPNTYIHTAFPSDWASPAQWKFM